MLEIPRARTTTRDARSRVLRAAAHASTVRQPVTTVGFLDDSRSHARGDKLETCASHRRCHTGQQRENGALSGL